MNKLTPPWLSLMWLAACALMMTGCASMLPPPEPQTAASPTSPALLKLCPPLPELKRGTTASLLTNRTQRAELYADCAVTHKRLVESIKLREALKKIDEDDDDE